jgi:cell division transport system permease protein
MNVWLTQHRAALALALRRLGAAPLNTLLAALAVGIALALPATGQMLLADVARLARNAAPTPQLSVFMARNAERAAVAAVEAQLRGHAGVDGVRAVPREETLVRMKQSVGLAEVIDVLPGNPFPDAFVVKPGDERPEAMEALRADFAKLPQVEHVQLDSAWVRRLDALLRLGRMILTMLAILFSVGLVAISFNSIRPQLLTQRAEIELSRLLGATDAFIRRPFYYHGCLQGATGGLVAWLVVGIAWWQLQAPVTDLARLYAIDFALAPPGVADGAMLVGFAAALGWLGTALSLRRHLAD